MNLFEQGLKKYLNKQQLKSIQSIKVGIGGAGGLGSSVAVILSRSGVKHLEVLDSDVIEPSNLNRQQYFLNEVGKDKVAVLKRRILQINPDVEMITHKARWNPKNGTKYFKNCDFIVEAFDEAKDKACFVEFYQDKTKFVISGNGMAGLLKKKPMTVKKIANVYIVGDRVSDTAAGNPPMAPRVTRCAAMMAEIILDLIFSPSFSKPASR